MSRERLVARLEELGCKGYPTSAIAEVTYACNATCKYCYVQHRECPDLPLGQWKTIFEKLSRDGVLTLTITGGEPFTRPDILPLLECAIRQDFFDLYLFTNGLLLTDEHFDFMREHRDRITYVQFSIFSHIASLHDSFMGINGSHELIIKNAQRLQSMGIQPVFSLSAMDFNIHTLMQTVLHYKNMGIGVKYSALKIIPSDKERQLVDASSSQDFFNAYFANFSPDERKMIADSFRMVLEAGSGNRNLCRGVYIGYSVTPQGNLAPCPTFGERYYGNIFQDADIHTIITESDLYKELTRADRPVDPKCSACEIRPICLPCEGKSSLENGEIGRLNQHQCNFAHAVNDLIRDVS